MSPSLIQISISKENKIITHSINFDKYIQNLTNFPDDLKITIIKKIAIVLRYIFRLRIRCQLNDLFLLETIKMAFIR